MQTFFFPKYLSIKVIVFSQKEKIITFYCFVVTSCNIIIDSFAMFQASRSLNSSPFYSREGIKTLFLSIFGGCNSLLPSFCIFFRGYRSSNPLTVLADILFLCSSSINNLESSGYYSKGHFFLSFKDDYYSKRKIVYYDL